MRSIPSMNRYSLVRSATVFLVNNLLGVMDFKSRQKEIGLLIFIVLYSALMYLYMKSPSPPSGISSPVRSVTPLPVMNTTDRILVLYVWAELDEQSVGNLEFFIRYGVHRSQPADYYFILQRMDKKPVDESRLPPLPPNAHYVQHDNECYDIGTMGWFLKQNIVNTTLYKYFFFMNSSIRGPYFVTYLESDRLWWFNVFTRRLNDENKLVGPSISCEQTAHVQSYLMATDQVGFTLLNGNTTGIFRCHGSYRDAVFDGEIAASQLILRSNYQIVSLQSKYQGRDFRKAENGGCNHGVSPIFSDKAMDGISHDPFELIFVKYKGKPPFDTDLERRAQVYQKWLEERPKPQMKNSSSS